LNVIKRASEPEPSTPIGVGPGISGLRLAAATRQALCCHLGQLAVLVHAFVTEVHPAVITEVGCLLLLDVRVRLVP
jgi:hypothetical protein